MTRSGGNDRPTPDFDHQTRSAARGSAALAVVHVSGRLTSLLFIFVAARAFEPAEFSRISIVAATVVIGGLFADFGTSPVIVREVSRSPAGSGRLLATAVPVSVALGLIAYVLAVGFAALTYSDTTAIDVAVGGLAIPMTSVSSTIMATLDGRGLIARRSLLTFSQVAVANTAGLAAVVATSDIRWVIAALPAGPAAALVLGTIVARQTRPATDTDAPRISVRPFLRMALPLALLNLISAVSLRFDVVLLSLLSTPSEVAIYDISLRTIEGLLALNTVITGPALYLLSSRLGRGDRAGASRAFTQVCRVAYVGGLLVGAGIVGLHGQLAPWLFGSAFADAGVTLAILGSHVWVALIGYAQGALLVAGADQRRGIVVAGVVTTVMAVFDLALIPPFGAAGAAAAALLTSIATVFAFASFHRKTNGIATPAPPLGALVAAAAAATTGVLVAPSAGVLLAGAAIALVFVAVAAATQTVHVDDFARVRHLLHRSAG